MAYIVKTSNINFWHNLILSPLRYKANDESILDTVILAAPNSQQHDTLRVPNVLLLKVKKIIAFVKYFFIMQYIKIKQRLVSKAALNKIFSYNSDSPLIKTKRKVLVSYKTAPNNFTGWIRLHVISFFKGPLSVTKNYFKNIQLLTRAIETKNVFLQYIKELTAINPNVDTVLHKQKKRIAEIYANSQNQRLPFGELARRTKNIITNEKIKQEVNRGVARTNAIIKNLDTTQSVVSFCKNIYNTAYNSIKPRLKLYYLKIMQRLLGQKYIKDKKKADRLFFNKQWDFLTFFKQNPIRGFMYTPKESITAFWDDYYNLMQDAQILNYKQDYYLYNSAATPRVSRNLYRRLRTTEIFKKMPRVFSVKLRLHYFLRNLPKIQFIDILYMEYQKSYDNLIYDITNKKYNTYSMQKLSQSLMDRVRADFFVFNISLFKKVCHNILNQYNNYQQKAAPLLQSENNINYVELKRSL